MFLKSLVIRGFKSFADRTVFEFTPGVAVVVGPNGSGKSNFVDAIAWVLGEQGPKTLRGGKMEDVIFAGTPTRGSLGRAEVALTIDNSAGVLPIEFTEVTVSRTLFRSGESEYAINGVPCRLLDVQELLSDTGVGRELHTVVGQGRLDEVLMARPEERRAYIEEAAGILKHRRRKERAVRKLERVDADIERLGDVIAELRRQIRPLEQQAELAKRAAEIETELREVRLRLWVLDYRAMLDDGEIEEERRTAEALERHARDAADASGRVRGLEAEIESAARGVETALGTEYRLGALRDRAAGIARLGDERAGHLADLAAREPRADVPSPDEIAEGRRLLDEARDARVAADEEAAAAARDWQTLAAAREEAARAREEILHLHGERAALRGAVESAGEERRRLADQIAAIGRDREGLRAELDAVRVEIERLDAEETALGRRLDAEEANRETRAAEAAGLAESVRRLERDREMLAARREALEAELLASRDPAPVLAGRPGVLGRLRDLVAARPGFERAALAALEPWASALLASSRGDALAALDALRGAGARGLFLVAETERTRSPLPPGTRGILDLVTPAGPAAPAIRRLLAGVAVAASLAEAVALSRAHPGLVVVTPDGDRVGPDLVAGGAPPHERDAAAELRRVAVQLADAEGALGTARRDAQHAAATEGLLGRTVRDLGAQLDALDARMTAAAERLAQLERDDHAAAREDAVLGGRLTEFAERLEADADRLRAVEARLSRSVAAEPPVDAATLARVERRAAEASLHLGELSERERTRAALLDGLEARVRRAVEERARWEAGRDAWLAGAERAGAVASAARTIAGRAGAWAEEAVAHRIASQERRTALADELGAARRSRADAEAALEEVRERAHRADLRRAERAHRLTSLVERLREEHGLAPEEALEAVAVAEDEREDLARRAQVADRRLGLLGRVNPIAMEQYQGLVDRHAFLTEQVNDLRKSRRDLMGVVAEVDKTIVEIFAQALADVSREFEYVFARLFPGGEGRVSLVDPDNILESGVEVESRPGGKRVKRTSLLSGGERALTAIALLFSIFRARPSPFYLLDEVEAALDDVNLHRFLEMTREFRERSQIILVTHQKRTMEIADVLYGISMGPEGVSRVIAEKLGEPAAADTTA